MDRGAGIDSSTDSFSGFLSGALATAVPNAYFSDVLPALSRVEELVVSLYFFFLAARPGGQRQPVDERSLRAEAPLVRALTRLSALSLEEALAAGLAGCVEHRLLLAARSGAGGKGYLLNTAANRKVLAAGGMPLAPEQREASPEAAVTATPNVFRLYEDNIGTITPLLAEELKDAAERYPAAWLEAAFHEAVSLNKRSWRYIAAILERWAAEGPDYETSGRNTEPDWLEQRYRATKRRRPYGE